jgi:hypothetical protein
MGRKIIDMFWMVGLTVFYFFASIFLFLFKCVTGLIKKD